jgi:alpha-tubulin suppressor-like RCC1 family protein
MNQTLMLGVAALCGVVACSSSSSHATTSPDGGSPGDDVGDAGGGDSAVTVSASGAAACALTKSGGIECFGVNGGGTLGNGSIMDSNTPVGVVGFTSGAIAVSVGYGPGFACGIKSGGALECWGNNESGELGNGTMNESDVPVQVTGLTSGVTAVSTGDSVACAIASGGAVQCWGLLNFDGMGSASTSNSNAPAMVAGLTSGVQAVSVGSGLVCAITMGGAVECVGQNTWGGLGNGSLPQSQGGSDSSVVVPVTGLTSGVTAVSAGVGSACAVTGGGGVMCWGHNDSGQLGNGTTTDSNVPVQVTGLTSGVTAVSIGESTACALLKGGAVNCWGQNGSYGQLGNNSMTDSSVPVPVSTLTSGVTSLSVGLGSACAVTATGGVDCWGEETSGPNGSSPVPVATPGF